jgi:hypothetical protein
MRTTERESASPAATLLGLWVEEREEPGRFGSYRVLVNHRTHQAVELNSQEAAICAGSSAACGPADASFLAQLGEGGFLASAPPPAAKPHRLTVSLSRLDLRWNGAGRLVQAAYTRGVRHLFHPGAVVLQVLLAIAGLAALSAAVFSDQRFQLRSSPPRCRSCWDSA